MSTDSMSLFLEACGATGPLELAVEHPEGEEAEPRTVHQPFVLLGRAPETDIVLEDPAVSLRHAYLQLIAGRLFCIDLQSRTGIHWDGKPEPRGWVKEGQALGIGPFRVRYFGTGPSSGEPRGGASALTASSPDSNHLPGLRLRLLNGAPRTNLSWQMQRVLALLGRSGSCKIRVIGPSVAMLHCSLVRTPMGVWVVNLPGRDVSINGETIQYALLQDGDELQVGDALFQVQYDSLPEKPTVAVLSPDPETEIISPAPRTRERPLTPESLPAAARSDPETWPPLAPVRTAQDTPRPVPFEASLSWSDSAPVPAGQQVGPELTSLLTRFAQQYALMQQQMLEQFRQAMLMMGQMFGDMHRDQILLLREEWERLHQVTQELHELQLQLANHTPPAPRPSPPPAPGPSRNGARKPEPAPQPARPSGSGKRSRSAARDKDSPPKVAASGASTQSQARPADGTAPRREADRAATAGSDDFHVRLTQRIAALQVERQSLWEKITSYLKPQGSGPS